MTFLWSACNKSSSEKVNKNDTYFFLLDVILLLSTTHKFKIEYGRLKLVTSQFHPTLYVQPPL